MNKWVEFWRGIHDRDIQLVLGAELHGVRILRRDVGILLDVKGQGVRDMREKREYFYFQASNLGRMVCLQELKEE